CPPWAARRPGCRRIRTPRRVPLSAGSSYAWVSCSFRNPVPADRAGRSGVLGYRSNMGRQTAPGDGRDGGGLPRRFNLAPDPRRRGRVQLNGSRRSQEISSRGCRPVSDWPTMKTRTYSYYLHVVRKAVDHIVDRLDDALDL